jgi:glycerophosphoryl diester phosphodiesterase
MVAPKLFAHLRLRGVQVWFLGVDTEQDLHLAVRTGATAVLTDRIHWLTRTMKENNWTFKKISQ